MMGFDKVGSPQLESRYRTPPTLSRQRAHRATRAPPPPVSFRAQQGICFPTQRIGARVPHPCSLRVRGFELAPLRSKRPFLPRLFRTAPFEYSSVTTQAGVDTHGKIEYETKTTHHPSLDKIRVRGSRLPQTLAGPPLSISFFRRTHLPHAPLDKTSHPVRLPRPQRT